MALNCGQLKRGISAPCDTPVGGLQTKLVQVRKDDIASVVRDASNPKRVAVTLKAGKKGFLFEGMGESNNARAKFAKTKYGSPTLCARGRLSGFLQHARRLRHR
jgi:hypothetical protein